MDSCVTAAIANETHRLALLHASYGQRTERRERRAFDEIADFYGVRERLVVRFDAFAQIGGSALTDDRIAVPESGEALAPDAGIPVTYVPFRNAHFLSAAVSWAEVIGATAIFIGAVAEDSSGYPDCRPEYYRAFAGGDPRGDAPGNAHRDRHAGDRDAEKRNRAPRTRSWARRSTARGRATSPRTKPAASCDSCRLRLQAFAEAGMRDPIAYRAQVAP